MSTPHALYRLFDAAGRLLYVGITLNPEARWRAHARTKVWWHDVATITLEEHTDRATVLVAETAAITTEHPVHNVTHNCPARPAQITPTRTPNRYLNPGVTLAAALERRARPAPGCVAVIGTVSSCDRITITLALIDPPAPAYLTIRTADIVNFRPIGHDTFYSETCDDIAPADMASLRRFKADWDDVGHRKAFFTVGRTPAGAR